MGSLTQTRPQRFSASELLTLTFQSTAPGKARDLQIVQEFRAKLRTAEEMVSKLGFSLREIQLLGHKPGSRGCDLGELAEPAKIYSVGSSGRSHE